MWSYGKTIYKYVSWFCNFGEVLVTRATDGEIVIRGIYVGNEVLGRSLSWCGISNRDFDWLSSCVNAALSARNTNVAYVFVNV